MIAGSAPASRPARATSKPLHLARRHPDINSAFLDPRARVIRRRSGLISGVGVNRFRNKRGQPTVVVAAQKRSVLWWREGDDEILTETASSRIRGAARDQKLAVQRLESSTRLPPVSKGSSRVENAAAGEESLGSTQSMVLEIIMDSLQSMMNPWYFIGGSQTMMSEDEDEQSVGRLERVRYKLSRAIWTSFTGQYYLLISMVAVISVIGGFLWAEVTGEDFVDGIWSANSFMLDAGTYAGVDKQSPAARVIALSLTIIGLLLVSVLVGIVSEAVETEVEKATQQPDVVLETGHMVILNWNETVPRLVQELGYGILDCDPDLRNETIVVLANANQKMMLQSCREVSSSAEVLCIRGSPQLISNLECVSACRARGIVILAEDGVDQEESDASAICTMLALAKAAAATDTVLPTVVMEVSSRDTLQLVLRTFGGKVVPILAGSFAAKMTVQAILMPGISSVFGELLSFRGSEFYFLGVPASLDGIKYTYLTTLVKNAIPVGIVRDEELCLLPPGGLLVEEGDQLVLLELNKGYATLEGRTKTEVEEAQIDNLATITSFSDISDGSLGSLDIEGMSLSTVPTIEDTGQEQHQDMDGTGVAGNGNGGKLSWLTSWLSVFKSFEERNRESSSSGSLMASVQASIIEDLGEDGLKTMASDNEAAQAQMRIQGPILICGWRPGMAILIKFLDRALRFGSEVHILSDVSEDKRDALLQADGLNMDYIRNIRLIHFEGSAASLRDLRQLPVIARNGYTAAVLLASRMEEQGDEVVMSFGDSDPMQLKSTLLLRDYFMKCEESSGVQLQDTYFVTEVRGTNTDACIPVSEFVEIGALDARVISQIIFQPQMHRLIKRLIDGTQDVVLAMEPSLSYGKKGEALPFQTLAQRVVAYRKTQSLLIGVMRIGQRPMLNPADQVITCSSDLKLVIMTRTSARAKSFRLETLDPSGSFDEEDDLSDISFEQITMR